MLYHWRQLRKKWTVHQAECQALLEKNQAKKQASTAYSKRYQKFNDELHQLFGVFCKDKGRGKLQQEKFGKPTLDKNFQVRK